MNLHYDYIICGSGAAGMSLLMRMMSEPFFNDKQILVIDKEEKNGNDHTWCFWEDEQDIFEPVVCKKWDRLMFKDESRTITSSVFPYTYKMIRSADLYAFVRSKAAERSNIKFISASVKGVEEKKDRAEVLTNANNFSAPVVFNSILFKPISAVPKKHLLLQHFKGWFIETEEDRFDADTATFMDFNVSQKHGTAFVYVLPLSERKALVEYTLFTESLLSDEEYEHELKNYLQNNLSLTNFCITEKEFGIIPMTNIPFLRSSEHIIHIGTAGGWTKPSTGFTFKNIQRQTKKIITQLMSGERLAVEARSKKFSFYDSVFLNVLANKRAEGKEIFSRMFQRNEMRSILRFLDDDTNLTEDISILKTLPTRVFMQAAGDELFG